MRALLGPVLARSGLIALAATGLSCGGAQSAPTEPEPNDSEPRGCEESRDQVRAAPLPPWTQPATTPPHSTVLAGPPRQVVRIEPPTARDPVDVVLSRNRRRVRSLSLHQAPVDDTLRMFATMGRFNVVIPGEVGSRTISIELRDVSLEGAFRAVLASARLEARVVSDNILEVRAVGER